METQFIAVVFQDASCISAVHLTTCRNEHDYAISCLQKDPFRNHIKMAYPTNLFSRTNDHLHMCGTLGNA